MEQDFRGRFEINSFPRRGEMKIFSDISSHFLHRQKNPIKSMTFQNMAFCKLGALSAIHAIMPNQIQFKKNKKASQVDK